MAGDAILIVDDNAANLKLARLALEGAAFQVRCVSDGEEALRALAGFRPRLILMDIQLPGIDGLELTRRLKADPATRDIVIVAVTAYAMKGDRERALGVGCDGYLSKPLDPIELPRVVAEFIQSAGTAAEAEAVALPPALEDDETPAAPEAARILLVEDNPTTRRMFRVALESAGYDVIEAADARMALELAAGRPLALVVQDLVLPDMDGLELARALAEQLGGAGVPIICVSGFLSRLEEVRALDGGFAEVLVKPVDPFYLLDVVSFHLAARSPAAKAFGVGRCLLLVDDDPLYLKLMRAWLGGVGFRVLTASDGAEALELARKEPADAIVSDVLMPRVDGFGLCLAVRRDPALASTPVVLVSANYDQDTDRDLATRVGASALVSKTDPEAIGLAVMDAFRMPPRAPAESAEQLNEEHARRVIWQLERQVAENKHLHRRTRLQEAELAVLAGVSESLGKQPVQHNVLGDVLASCLDMAGISKGALYLLEGATLKLRHEIGFSGPQRPRALDAFGCPALLLDVARQGRVVLVPSEALRVEDAQTLILGAGVTSLLLVPVTCGSKVYGVMVLGTRSADMTGDDARAFARTLGAQVGQALALATALAEGRSP